LSGLLIPRRKEFLQKHQKAQGEYLHEESCECGSQSGDGSAQESEPVVNGFELREGKNLRL